MNLLRQLGRLFSTIGTRSGGSSGSRYLDIYVFSRRCREPLHGQVDLYNEVSASEEGGYAYYTRKVLHTSGDRRCFDQVEVNLYFDQNKKLAHHEIVGGSWLSEAEYEAELVRFNTPPDEPGDQPPAPTH
jgi:hypothetical protein